VTYVVDKQPSFCYTKGRKAAAVVSDWALPKIKHALCNQCGAFVELCPTVAVDMVLLGNVEERRRLS
jgi:Na+-translocating ferredoxin:NAD+ oxidoreductase RNF subunit RnfB